MFIGRQEELKFLEDRYHTDMGQLVVLYGRSFLYNLNIRNSEKEG